MAAGELSIGIQGLVTGSALYNLTVASSVNDTLRPGLRTNCGDGLHGAVVSRVMMTEMFQNRVANLF